MLSAAGTGNEKQRGTAKRAGANHDNGHHRRIPVTKRRRGLPGDDHNAIDTG